MFKFIAILEENELYMYTLPEELQEEDTCTEDIEHWICEQTDHNINNSVFAVFNTVSDFRANIQTI